MSDLIETRCACCQQPLGLLPRIAGLTAELDHYRDCLADDQVYGLAQKNRADLAEGREKRLRDLIEEFAANCQDFGWKVTADELRARLSKIGDAP